MSDPDNPQPAEEQLAARLRAEAGDLPPEIALRLVAARRAAVAQAERPSPFTLEGWRLLGAGGAAVAVLALSIMVLLGGSEPVPEIPFTSELEFAAAQELELLEALEFVAWLEEEDSGAG